MRPFWFTAIVISLTLSFSFTIFSGSARAVSADKTDKVETQAEPLSAASRIEDIEYLHHEEVTIIYVRTDGDIINYKHFELNGPSRIVLDLRGVENATGKDVLRVGNRFVNKVRVGSHPGKVRMVFDIEGEKIHPYMITRSGNDIVITFGEFLVEKEKPEQMTAERPKDYVEGVTLEPKARPEDTEEDLLETNKERVGGVKRKNGVTVDFDKPPRTAIELTPNLTFGARLELESQLEKDFDLDSGDPDDVGLLIPSVSLAMNYTPTVHFSAFLNAELAHNFYDDDEGKKENKTMLEIKQAFLSFDEVYEGLNVRLGRQRITDSREWLYDEELDGIRVFYSYSRFALDASITENNDKDILNEGDDEQVTNFVLYGIYVPKEDHEIAGYVLVRNDRSGGEQDPVFLGLSLSGEDKLDDYDYEYWLQLAGVGGTSGSNNIRGYGLDLGGTLIYDESDYEPAITLGYAFGTGDSDPDDGTDTDFRQTGLHDNSAKFNGIAKIKYYGEMLDPELSNMHIFTAGLGVRPTKDTSVDLVYHYYLQHRLSDEIRDSELDEDPSGEEKNLGSEIDLILGFRAKPHWKGSFTLGYFIPGEAFSEDSDNALFAELKIRYDF